jgi:hypothetical protein
MRRSNGIVRAALRLPVAGLGLLLWLLLPWSATAAPRQGATPAAALACDAHQPSLSFALQSDGGGTVLQPPDSSNAALEVGLSRLAVACQAVFVAPDAAGAAVFDLPAGTVTFTVSGPGMLVENNARSLTVACGSAAQNLACTGALPAGDAGVTGTAALTVHVAVLPLATLPPLPAPGAVGVTAVYQEDPALGGAGATASAAIDLAPPRYAATASVDRTVVTGGTNASAVVTVQLYHPLLEGCAPLSVGLYLFCSGESLQPGDAGAEPGTVTLTTTLGLFPNGESTIAAACDAGEGQSPGGQPALTAPPPGVDAPFRYTCTDVRVRLAAAGFAGEATVTAQFTGAITGATAQSSVTVTIAPGPATLQLIGGCTPAQAPSGLPAAAPIDELVGSITPSSAVVAVWRHDPDTGWQALYLRGGGPVDGATVDPGEPLYICVDALAQYPLG